MKKNKIFILGIIYAASVAVGIIYKPKNVWSETCPFDSYMILDSKCIDLTNKSDVNTNTVHQTIYKNDSSRVERLSVKTCKDFKYQVVAQSYFDRNLELKSKFDSDNDGYVCENLERTDKNILTKEIWRTLLYENYQRKKETKNKHALTFKQVYRIIGFSPSLKKKNGKHVWEDPINNRKIEVRFFDDEIEDMKGIGF